MTVEIVEHIKDKFPIKHRSIIIDEIVRVVSKPHHNKGLDVRVFDINISYHKAPGFTTADFNTEEKDARIISIKVLFLRIDKNKEEEYRTRDTRHLGIQIFLPKKIKERRTKILTEIFDTLPVPSKI